MEANTAEAKLLIDGENVRGSSGLQFAILMHSFLFTLPLGCIVVVTGIPLNVLAFVAWAMLLCMISRRTAHQCGPASGYWAALTQIVLMGLIITAAYLAPVKSVDRFLDRSFTLSKTAWSLDELGYARRPSTLPRGVLLLVPEEEDKRAAVIHFPSTTLTVRQFVRSIEDQTGLRHRFSHCGNCSSILWGGDVANGMYLSEWNDAGRW